MSKTDGNRQKILIVDDSEMNRSILADMLEDEFEILEAENGVEGIGMIQKMGVEISLIMLDIVMPEMDGFEVLALMNKYHWIEDIPVIMISAENSSAYVERAYELGVTDYISRPFDAMVVHRRVINTIMLYAKQKRLIDLVADQIYEKEKSSSLMVAILSHIVEFRNGESGLHVLHISTLTDILLKSLTQKTDQYHLSYAEIGLITTASALHDIGKIAIPAEILNKPGRLTKEEFEVMKTHAEVGASMLQALPFHQEEALVKVAYEICRWHHERYDGRGYPDGLKGDAIPLAAQIVSLADVYDALTSERVYKSAYSHERALEMIVNGECGAFNPLLLDCLLDAAETIRTELQVSSPGQVSQKEVHMVVGELLEHGEMSASERTLRLLEQERTKYQFFAFLSEEVQFEYTADPPMVTISEWGAERLGLKAIIMDPKQDEEVLHVMGVKNMRLLTEKIRETTPENAVAQFECQMQMGRELRWNRIVCRTLWTMDDEPKYTGLIGKLIDIHEEKSQLLELQQKASHDLMTGLLNREYARAMIEERLEQHPNGHFVLVIFDLDYFKQANDTYGHVFGDHVLCYVAELLHHCIRNDDIAARAGGDEFLLFLEGKDPLEPIVERIHHSLHSEYEGFPISISMGAATNEVVGNDYEELFHCADKALYSVKKSEKGHLRFYDESLQEMLSVISEIESEQSGESGT